MKSIIALVLILAFFAITIESCIVVVTCDVAQATCASPCYQCGLCKEKCCRKYIKRTFQANFNISKRFYSPCLWARGLLSKSFRYNDLIKGPLAHKQSLQNLLERLKLAQKVRLKYILTSLKVLVKDQQITFQESIFLRQFSMKLLGLPNTKFFLKFQSRMPIGL